VFYFLEREPGQLSVTELGYELDDPGFEPRQMLKIFLFPTLSRPALGPTQPPFQRVSGAFSFTVKRPGCEDGQSPPSRSRMGEIIPPFSKYAFIGWFSVKAQEQFHLYLPIIYPRRNVCPK
jgi:hypothetical protein